MSYIKIPNLYKSQDILLFKECYALEKIHGTSGHISWRREELGFYAGGQSHSNFKRMFNLDVLAEKFSSLKHDKITVHGEMYGGKCQGMRETYGDEIRFIAFDVKIDDLWVSVPNMAEIAGSVLGLDVVDWCKVSTDLAVLDAERDKPSVLAKKNGCGDDKRREGIVLRPLIELVKNNGERVIAKHKIEAYSERATPQKVIDPKQLKVLTEANEIADEWVSEQRMVHVLDKFRATLPEDTDFTVRHTKQVIDAMVEDIYQEAEGEIVTSKEAKRAICARAAKMFTSKL